MIIPAKFVRIHNVRFKAPGKEWKLYKNLVTTVGEEQFGKLMRGATATAPTHAAFGDSATLPSKSQTALLGTEHERVALSSSQIGTTVIWTATFGAGIGSLVYIREIGIFDDPSAGNMFARFLVDENTMGTGETAYLEWSLSPKDIT